MAQDLEYNITDTACGSFYDYTRTHMELSLFYKICMMQNTID